MIPGSFVFGAGTNWSRNLRANGAMRLAGITLPGNGWPVRGSRSTVVIPLKSPCLIARVGSVRRAGVVKRRIFFHSSPPKKKSLSRLTGPPRFQPKSLKRSFCLMGEKKLRASNLSLRMNSKPPP